MSERPWCEATIDLRAFRPDPNARIPFETQAELHVEHLLREAGFVFDGDGPGCWFVGRWERDEHPDGSVTYRQWLEP